MQNFVERFSELGYCEFIRVVVFDDAINLFHIKSGRLHESMQFSLMEKTDAFAYLKSNLSTPIECIISSSSMSCKSICANKLSQSDLKMLATNTLLDKKESINMVCYERRLMYRRGSIPICEMKMSPVILLIVQELLSLKNSIISVACWPVWIISSYFDLYPDDKTKFKTSLFIIETEKRWEIIALYTGKYVCYRQGSTENFNKKIELENTIKYLHQLLKVNPSEIAIYSIEESTISNFLKPSPIDMEIVSKAGKLSVLRNSKSLSQIIKIACITVFFAAFINTLADILKIFDYGSSISESEVIINSVDKNIIKEIAMWDDVDGIDYISHINFRDIIEKHAEKSNSKKLKSAAVAVDEKTSEVKVSTIPDDQDDK